MLDPVDGEWLVMWRDEFGRPGAGNWVMGPAGMSMVFSLLNRCSDLKNDSGGKEGGLVKKVGRSDV